MDYGSSLSRHYLRYPSIDVGWGGCSHRPSDQPIQDRSCSKTGYLTGGLPEKVWHLHLHSRVTVSPRLKALTENTVPHLLCTLLLDFFAQSKLHSDMSFGFSVGDFVAVGELAWKLYKSCTSTST